MNKLIRRVRDHGHLLGWEASTVRVYMSGRISGFPFFFILQQLTSAVEQPFWIFGASIKVPQLLDVFHSSCRQIENGSEMNPQNL
ncbi:unnamed protein product [Nesidiocoris tenuis]|uniref:Uncharacterized protein n=1 Tax=Nesidiocoris tenuis TaxID=355587 RepID=A0A6H5GQE9_9HEMI|nr:unnamed protein product [Nesidiocoris tenuis]